MQQQKAYYGKPCFYLGKVFNKDTHKNLYSFLILIIVIFWLYSIVIFWLLLDLITVNMALRGISSCPCINLKKQTKPFIIHYAEACNEFSVPITAS